MKKFPATLKHPFVRILLAAVLGLSPNRLTGQVTDSFTEPMEQRQVAASEPGAIAEVFVQEGQRVQAGDILAQLQIAELQQKKKLAELRANSAHKVNSAKARAAARKKQLDALVPMLEQGHANQAEVEKAELDFDVAEAELAAAQQEIEEYKIECALIEAEIERRTIRSPIAGVVVQIHTKNGEYISASEPAFASVALIQQLRVRFYLLPRQTEHLREGDTITLELDSNATRSCQAKVLFISPVTDPDSGTTRVDVAIENSDFSIRSGTPCHWPSTR